MGRRVALVIANHQYSDPGLRQLTAPANDAEALAAVLGDPEIAGFEVTTLVDEPHHRVGAAIGDFYRDRRHDDLALLYFSGHGLKDDAGRLYLAMTDTRRDSLLFTALSAQQLDQAMEGCVSRRMVLILDCCYSGAFPAGRLAKGDPQVHALERLGGRGRTVLTASDATQYAFEGDQVTGSAVQSVFTRHLVAGLRDGTADLDGDGDITLDELYSYVHDRVTAELPQQRPKRQDDVEGRIVIARNVHWTLPGYVRNALASPIAADRLGALDALEHLHRIGNGMVRERVAGEIRRLGGDDSRAVSAEAEARLRVLSSGPAGDGVRSGSVAPDPLAPDPLAPAMPASMKPEPAQPEPVQPEPVQPEPVQPEPLKPEPTTGESITVQATRQAIRDGIAAVTHQRAPSTPATSSTRPAVARRGTPATNAGSPRPRWLNLAIVFQLVFCLIVTVAKTAPDDSSLADTALSLALISWGLVLISLAGWLTGFAPARNGRTPWQRGLHLAGAAMCAASGCGLVAQGIHPEKPALWVSTVVFLAHALAVVALPILAVRIRLRGSWNTYAAAALCVLVVTWLVEAYMECWLLGVPELVALGVLAGATRKAVPRGSR
ncbi:caspase family protein [Longispora sp. NPDC051575]|uniref:caspase, EACC1-associated type n=1 Tax=Longispora sp. NPDC051575 TaxID=3154943 RepID=UPI00343A218F